MLESNVARLLHTLFGSGASRANRREAPRSCKNTALRFEQLELRLAPAVNFAPEATFGVGSNANFVAVGDFNGDGKPDLATSNYNSDNVSVLLGNGDGTFQAQTTYGVGDSPRAVAVADFNGDGKPDLAAANYGSDTVSVLLGKGDGDFQAQATFAAGIRPNSALVADFNGDGKPDLAAANGFSEDSVSVLLGHGDGTFQAPAAFGVQGIPHPAVGDFNGDGKPDLVTANEGTQTVSVLLGIGDGTFQAQATFGAGAGNRSVTVGDFNADGKADLVVATSALSGVRVYLGYGDGTFKPQATFGVGGQSTSVAVGDFNGDGAPDLAATDLNNNNISVLLGNGDGTFKPLAAFSAGTAVRHVAVGDFNGDGKPDLAVTDVGRNVVSVLKAVTPANGTVQFASSATSFDENGGSQSVTVRLTGAGILAEPLTVPVTASGTATSGSDFTFATSVTFPAGVDLATNPTQPATFTLLEDALLEVAESFTLSLGAIAAPPKDDIILGVQTSHVVTIADNESATLNIATASSVTEAGGAQPVGAVTMTITGTGTAPFSLGSGISVSADVTQTGGTATSGDDYSPFGIQTVTFNLGAASGTTKNTTLTALEDALLEGSESVALTLGNLGGSAVTKSLGVISNTTTIADNESATLDIAAASSVTEAGGAQLVGVVTMTITGTGTGPFSLGSGISIMADVTQTGGDAISGDDYSPFGIQTVTFNLGAASGTTKNTTLTALDDTLSEGFETVFLTLGNLGGSTVTKALGATANTTTIADDDLTATISGPTSSFVGETVTFIVTLTPPELPPDVVGPTGTVNLMEGSTVLDSAPVVETTSPYTYTATFEIDTLPLGLHTITANYLGDANWQTSTTSNSIGITVNNNPPTLTTFAAPVDFTNQSVEVELTFAELAAQGNEADVDGTVTAFVVQAVSTGALKIGASAATATPFAAGTNDTIDATRKAYWRPAIGDKGPAVNAFKVVAKDNSAALSTGAVQVRVNVNEVSAVYIDYGVNGFWRWTNGGGFKLIHPADAESFSVGADGYVYIDFGVNGLWRWAEAAGFQQIHTANAENVVAGHDGFVYIDFGNNGFWRWSQATKFIEFHAGNPESFAISNDGIVYIDFGSYGLYRWSQATKFVLIHAVNPENIQVGSDNFLYVDFGEYGLWRWSSATNYVLIHTANPDGFTIGPDGFLTIDFGRNGLWRWSPATRFVQIHAANAEEVVAGNGFVFIDFGSAGLWRWSQATGYLQIHLVSPQRIWA